MKKQILTGLIFLALYGCVHSESISAETSHITADATTVKPVNEPLVVWSFTEEVKTMNDIWYAPGHPNVTVELTLIPTDEFESKLDSALASGEGAPDIIALEDIFVRKYIESGLLLDLSDIAAEVKNKELAYPIEVGSFGGKTYGLTWQATPGALFYRRSLAKKYLGTDDPAEVQKYVSSFDRFAETAALLKNKSEGMCVILPSTADIFIACKAARSNPWIVDGKLTIDPEMISYMEMAKTFKNEGYDGRAAQWTQRWFNGMKEKLKNDKGNNIEVFSYFLPTWGLHYVLKTNTPETTGDWAMVEGPAPYRWGGTWLAALKGTKNPEDAKDFIRYISSDYVLLGDWATSTGDVVSNTRVLKKVKDAFSEPFLNGQNHYAQFAEIAAKVNGKLSQASDKVIEDLFNEAVRAFANGEKNRDTAIEDFTRQVNAQLGL